MAVCGFVAAGDRVCYKCGGCGHEASACEAAVETRSCHRCGGVGHLASDCTAEGTEMRRCFHCGRSGHVSAACPEAGERQAGACYNCGEEGHTSRNCPKPVPKKHLAWDYDATNAAAALGAGKKCNHCGEKGHLSAACPSAADGCKKVCFAFRKGKCKRGDECHFAHEIAV